MTAEKEEKLKSKMIQQIVGAVSFAEIVKIVHELATREVDFHFTEFTEEQKDELYKEIFESNGGEVPELPSEEAPAV